MKHYIILFISLFFLSCEEEITLDLPQATEKLVVEGVIEPGYPPYVILTRNQGYFDPINIDTYNNLFVNNVDSMQVWFLDDNGQKIIKNLDIIPDFGEEIIPLYTVTDLENIGDGDYEFSQEGRTYFLKIEWNNQIITAQTTIPLSTPLDCLWVEESENAEKDFKCDIRAVYSDPADQQNNFLIKSKRLQHYELSREDTLSCDTVNYPDFPFRLIDSGSDILVNGQTFETYFPRPKDDGGFPTGSYNSSRTKNCNGTSIEMKEDVVLIKFCQIDEASMKFWRGLVRQAGTNGNPFAEPKNLVSNINGGLGIFTGYSPVYYKVPIVKDTTIQGFETYTPNFKDIF